MAEIVGVAATATQLATVCFSLLDLIKKIKGGSSTLQKYHEQLQELRSLSHSISQNPLLQTTEVGTYTQYLLSVIDENCLASLLQKGRLTRTWGFIYKERDLLNAFASLERQKANLSLLIEEIQARAIHQIQVDIRHMAGSKPSKAFLNPETTNPDRNKDSNRTIIGTMSNSSAKIELVRDSTHPSNNPIVARASTNNTNPGSKSNQYFQEPQHPMQQDFRQSGGRWDGCRAGPGVTQINGLRLEIDAKDLETLSSKPLNGYYRYTNVVKEGNGDQVNGADVFYSKDLKGPGEVVMNGEWTTDMVPSQFTVSPVQGKQINGGRMTKLDKRADVTDDE